MVLQRGQGGETGNTLTKEVIGKEVLKEGRRNENRGACDRRGNEVKSNSGEASVHMHMDLAKWDLLVTSIAVTTSDTRRVSSWPMDQVGEKVDFSGSFNIRAIGPNRVLLHVKDDTAREKLIKMRGFATGCRWCCRYH